MIDDYSLHQFRVLAVEPMENAEGDGSGAAILLGVSLFFVIYRRLKGAQIIKL